ncbi:MAG TPA: DMT family transporter [Symbiobacteriaceae bacterium]|nr:DMT family transporter [Symbiobacteriaceae bacterium]
MATQPASKPSIPIVDLALVLVALIWGINAPIVKASLAGWDQLAYNAIRFPSAAVLLFLYVVWTDKGWRLTRKEFWHVALLGLIGNGLYQWMYIEAMPRSSASNVSVIIALSPLVVSVWGMVTGIERRSLLVVGAAAASVSGGAMVILGGPDGVHLGGPTLVGDLIAVAAMLAWGAYTVYSRPVINRVGSSLRVTAWAMMFGAMTNFLIGIPSLLHQDFAAVTAASVAGMTYSALLSLLVGYVLFNWGVSRIGGARTAIYISLSPIFAAVVAMLFLHEIWSPVQWIGAAFVIGGVALSKIANVPSSVA